LPPKKKKKKGGRRGIKFLYRSSKGRKEGGKKGEGCWGKGRQHPSSLTNRGKEGVEKEGDPGAEGKKGKRENGRVPLSFFLSTAGKKKKKKREKKKKRKRPARKKEGAVALRVLDQNPEKKKRGGGGRSTYSEKKRKKNQPLYHLLPTLWWPMHEKRGKGGKGGVSTWGEKGGKRNPAWQSLFDVQPAKRKEGEKKNDLPFLWKREGEKISSQFPFYSR